MKNDWVTTRLSDVSIIQSGAGFPDRYQGQKDRDVPFYKVSDMNLAGNEREMIYENNSITEVTRRELGAFLFPKGSTIFPKIGGAIATNKKRLTSRECCVDNNVMGVIPRREHVDSEFLFYFFLAHDLSDFANGAHLPSIKKSVVEDWPITLPRTLAEQRRIVALLDDALESIATAKATTAKSLQNVYALFESHLHILFTQGDSARGLHQLGEICEEITVGYVGPMAAQYKAAGVPFLRSQNVRPFRISMDNLVFIDEQFHRSLAKSALRPGDVAIVRTGYPGTAAVIPESLPECNCSDLVIVRPGKAIDPHYLALFFNSDHGKGLVAGSVVGAAQKHFNITAAKHVNIALPAVAEQRVIVATLDVFRKETECLGAIYKRKLAALETLRKSILHQAFSGQL